MADFQSFTQLIINTANIVEVIGEYVRLTNKGRNHLGLCPFHNEKTPSFTVSPEKNFFHCFGCGESGNVIGFLMKYKKITFWESVKELADKYSIKMPQFEHKSEEDRDEYNTILTILKATADLYNKNLLQNHESYHGLEYLKGRKLSDDSIAKFNIGMSFNDWDGLFKHLTNESYTLDILLKAGVVIKTQKGNLIDKFNNRIIFPIVDEFNRTVGFGGRVFNEKNVENNVPKYLNSQESDVFKKRLILYGLNFAQNTIRALGFAVVVEGYLDVIMCHQFGFANVVAPLGTGLTIEHIKRLERFTERILLIFDGDSAGISATKRAIIQILRSSLHSYVVILPENKDPFDYLVTYGPAKFQKLLDSPKTALDFILEHEISKFDIATLEGKQRCLGSVFDFLVLVNDEIKQDLGIKKISEMLNLDDKFVRNNFLKRVRGSKVTPVFNEEKKQEKKLTYNEKDLSTIFLMIHNIEYSKEYFHALDKDMLKDELCKELLTACRTIIEKRDDEDITVFDFDIDEILSYISNDEYKNIIISQMLLKDKFKASSTLDIQKAIARIEFSHNKENYHYYQKLIATNKDITPEVQKQYLEELIYYKQEMIKKDKLLKNLVNEL